MRKHKSSVAGTNIAFLDMVFNMVLGFAFLFILAWMLVRPPTQTDANIKLKAEIVLTMTWPDGSGDDVDMWLLLPDEQKVYYRRKDVDYVTLDRDDRGIMNDTFYDTTKGGMNYVRMNKEMMTIRATVPGRYVVAGHVFASEPAYGEFKSETTFPYEAKLVVTKLNPIVSDVVVSTIVLEGRNDRKAFVAFTVMEDGTVTNIEMHPDDEIVDVDGK